jgi:DNA-binding CsgD family transcriptional regulator/energy-coupling factor transporter ATP-binding protein EcfA2
MVGRDDEVNQVLAALDDSAGYWGVVLTGESGVGKSTLARALAGILESRGRTVRFALCTETRSAVPFGAFYWLMTPQVEPEPAVMLAAAHRTLEREQNLVIAVDDAELLDPLSASLLCQLVARGNARLIVTIGSGNAMPDTLAALWKERMLLSLRINAFTRQQTETLARTVLGGVVASRLIDELQDRTAGNPLLLRGLLIAGQENGVLVHADAGWQLFGTLRGDRQLYDLLEFRLRSFAPEELEVVEVLGAAEVLDWEVLRGLCDADAVGRLERRGIIQLVADGSHTVARLFHAVLGEAAIQRAGVVRSRQLNGLLAQHLRKQMQAAERHSRRADVRTQIQLAQLTMRSDLAPDFDMMINAAVSALRMWDIDCSEKLARFVFERGGGLPAATVLVEALGWRGANAEAESILADVEPEGPGDLVTAHGCLRAANLFWGGQIEQARLELVNLRERIEPGGSAELITAMEVMFAYFSGDVSTATELGLALCSRDVPPVAKAWAAASTCWALAQIGRYGDFHRITNAGVRAAALGNSGPLQLVTGLAEVRVLTDTGDFAAAKRVWERYAAMPAGALTVQGAINAMLGLVNLAQGALLAACPAFHDSLSAMSRGAPFTWLMVVAAWTAQAEGGRGNNAAAAAALRRSEKAYGPQTAVYLPDLELARAWERASVGEMTAAQIHSVRAAQTARKFGMHADEMRALHTAVRFGDQSCAAKLEELARTMNTPLAEAIAAHASGLANHDGDRLDVAARQFAYLGAVALAADAAAQAAAEHKRSGHRAKNIESSARAYGLAQRGGLRTPAVDAAARPLPITPREREVGMLVSSGLSNRQIADRLVVSVRTAEGHLYRIFAKLAINSRDQLTQLLDLDQSGTKDDVPGRHRLRHTVGRHPSKSRNKVSDKTISP